MSLFFLLDNKFALFNDKDFKNIALVDKDLNKVWQQEIISYYPTYCSVSERIVFYKKNESGDVVLETINKIDGTQAWRLDLNQYKVRRLGCHEGRLFLILIVKNKRTDSKNNVNLCSINMETGKILEEFSLMNYKGILRFTGELKYDKYLSRFVGPVFELDFNTKTILPRSYFKKIDIELLAGLVGKFDSGIWNNRYYIDSFDSEKFHLEKMKSKKHPYRILVFDRIHDKLVSETIVDKNNPMANIVEFNIHNDKLYALDNFKNLRIYDFSEFADPVEA